MISVIVPVYNVSKYLRKCVESILVQTYTNIQIILVDDGSTDGSRAICDEYAALDSRVYVIHQSNGGLVKARKAGLRIASGKYIGFVDADDWIEPTMYEEYIKYIEREKVDFIHAGFYREDRGKTIAHYTGVEGKYNIADDRVSNISNICFDVNSDDWITASIWSKLYKAELIKSAYEKVPDENQLGEDAICLVACILECNTMYVVHKAFYHYLIRDDSMDHICDITKISKNVAFTMAIVNLLKVNNICDELDESLKKYLITNLTGIMIRWNNDFRPERFCFPNIRSLLRSEINNVIIYGAGNVGYDYYTQLSRYKKINIVAWVDLHAERYSYEFCEIDRPDQLEKFTFDFVLIAVLREKRANEIKKSLLLRGIKEDKIIWEKPRRIF